MSESDIQLDDKVRAAFGNVPVPAQAMERVRQRLRAEAAELTLSLNSSESASSHSLAGGAAEQPTEPSDQPTQVVTRRTWTRVAGRAAALLATAAGLGFVLLQLFGGPDLTRESVARLSSEMAESIESSELAWDTSLSQLPQHAVQQLAVGVELDSVAKAEIPNLYAGASSKGRRCEVWKFRTHASHSQLYWIRASASSNIPGLISSLQPLTNSGKWSVAAMQVNGELMVLVCRGDVKPFIRNNYLT